MKKMGNKMQRIICALLCFIMICSFSLISTAFAEEIQSVDVNESIKMDRKVENIHIDEDVIDSETQVESNDEENEISLNAMTLNDENEIVAKIGDVGYKSLNEAVENANDDDTIVLVADVKLSQKITLEKKSITITADSDCTISGNSDLIILIEVPEGASLTLGGHIIIDGSDMKRSDVGYHSQTQNWYYLYNGIGMLDIHGTLTIKDYVNIQNYKLGENAGAINVSGNSAKVYLNSGTIKNNNTEYGHYLGFCAPVRVGNNAEFIMTGGTITNNEIRFRKDDGSNWSGDLAYYTSGGIFVSYSGRVDISGGSITNNMAFRGSAIHMYGGTTCTISDNALISNNTCGDVSSLKNATQDEVIAAGAIYIDAGGTLNMSGGHISNNKGGSGGGVTISSNWVNNTEKTRSNFNLMGGIIDNNEAICGGGIYSYSNGTHITGGKIINNTAKNLGGAIYSEGNVNNYSTVYLKNAVIHDNTATLEGGGLWLCPTGESEIYINEGCAIYNNNASYDAASDYYNGDTALNGSAAGDDVASGSQSPHSLTLSSRILGGGSIGYYIDGGLKSVNGWPYPVVDNTINRYGKNTNTLPLEVINSSENLALKSKSEAVSLAESLAKVEIYGNTARYGGGIGANGGVIIGTDEEALKEIEVEKIWKDNEDLENLKPSSITVDLLVKYENKTYKIDSIVLNEENNWAGCFENLPSQFEYETEYMIVEEEIENYESEIQWDGNKVTITNTLKQNDEEDKPSDDTVIPTKTGDNQIISLWGLLIIISIIGFIFVRRKNNLS